MDPTEMNEQRWEKKEKIEQELNCMYNYLAEGAILRSRCTWYEKGEKSTKYFLSLEKTQAQSTNIDVLDTGEELIENPHHIQNFGMKSFGKQFENRDTVSDKVSYDYIKSSFLKHITDDEKTSCEGLITHEEAKEVLLGMYKIKTPGNDGLSGEFYQTFLPLSHILC